MLKRLIAPLTLLLFLVGIGIYGAVTRSDGRVRVQAEGESTTTLATATTQTPVTTSTSIAPTTTMAPTTVVTTVPTTEEPTTTPPTDPPTTPAPVPTEPVLKAQNEVPEAVDTQPPTPAARTATGVCMTDEATCHPPETPARTSWRYCEQWHELAAEVGWPESQGSTLSYVMHRESGCDPNAYNRSGATGLMQLLGWRCDGGCFNPEGNLRKALDLWQSSGWCPWVLRGDPVTGHACG